MKKSTGNSLKPSFNTAETVCRAVHNPDQSFVVKLLLRKDGNKRPSQCKFELGTYADHASNFKAWRSADWEPFMMLAVTDGEGYSNDNMVYTWGRWHRPRCQCRHRRMATVSFQAIACHLHFGRPLPFGMDGQQATQQE
jgi:hypothetical protein